MGEINDIGGISLSLLLAGQTVLMFVFGTLCRV